MIPPVSDDLISAYFDGEVTPEERQQVEQLIESSDELRQLLDDTAKLSALLHSFPRETAPAELAQSVQQKVETLSIKPVASVARKPSLRREWLAFGAGMMVTMASLLVYVSIERPQSLTALGMNDVDAVDRRKFGDGSPSATMFKAPSSKSVAESPPRGDGLESPDSWEHLSYVSSPAPQSRYYEDSKSEAKFAEQQMALTRTLKSEAAPVEPPDLQDYLWGLKNGDVIARQVVDPASVIAVGEFTVVDSEKAAEEVMLLLQKRDVQNAEEAEQLKSGKEVADLPPLAMNRSPESQSQDGPAEQREKFYVIYARAKGNRLAETITEFKDHPDVCKKFEAQLPIGLPDNYFSDTANSNLASRDKEDAVKADDNLSVEASSISEEGNKVVNYYAINNGLTANNTVNLKLAESANKREADHKSNEGFATFRVEVDPQRRVANVQNTPTQQNFGFGNNSLLAANSGASINSTTTYSLGSQTNTSRNRNMRSVADQRDPRLIRMLFVLKPVTITSATNP